MSTEVMSGWVTKCGKSVKTWRRRWFVLKHNGFLYYYENSSQKNEKGKIDVTNCKMIGAWSEVATADKVPSAFLSSNAFALVAPERTYTCVCDKPEECGSWIAALKKCKDNSSDQQYPEPTYPKEENSAVAAPIKPPPYNPAGGPPPQAVSPLAPPPPYSPSPAPVPVPASYRHSLPPPASNPPPFAQQRSSSSSTLPMAGPGYTQSYPVGNYPPRPNPYPPAAPSYQQPPPPQAYAPSGYAPRPPAPVPYAPQQPYQPPPPQPYYYQRPPPAPYQPRPVYQPARPVYQPPRPVYQPPRQAYYRPPPQPQNVTRRTTNVTVVTIPAAQPRVVYRYR